ncbi:MAG: arginine--tRNA ligase [bacterium]
MKSLLEGKINQAVKKLYGLDYSSHIDCSCGNSYGDYATNVAMKLAGQVKKNPQEIAQEIIAQLKSDKQVSDVFSEISVANGFINFKFSDDFLQKELARVLREQGEYLCCDVGKKQKVQIEFISANPTGPITIANARGGFLGDVLAKILKKAGFDVQKEYYVNDVGKQIEILAESVARRVLELKGQKTEFPDYCYQGEYVKDIAEGFLAEVKTEYNSLGEIAEAAKNYSLFKIIDWIKNDLKESGIEYDRWFFESELYAKPWYQARSEIDKTMHWLDEQSLLEQKDGAMWFKSSDFGDDKDRVVVKEGGEKTYFASDIAYFKNKIDRGFGKIIEIWGADHYGYIPRIKAVARVLNSDVKIDFILTQMVRLVDENGNVAKMSKRAGHLIKLKDLLNEVGLDALRFFFLMYSANTHMDFNVSLAKEKSQKNPVFYLQYAHARIASVLKKAAEENKISLKKIKSASLNANENAYFESGEKELIKKLIKSAGLIKEVSSSYEASKLAHYCLELAKSFHDYYENNRIISDDSGLTMMRLRVILAVKIILSEMLNLMGISAPEKM